MHHRHNLMKLSLAFTLGVMLLIGIPAGSVGMVLSVQAAGEIQTQSAEAVPDTPAPESSPVPSETTPADGPPVDPSSAPGDSSASSTPPSSAPESLPGESSSGQPGASSLPESSSLPEDSSLLEDEEPEKEDEELAEDPEAEEEDLVDYIYGDYAPLPTSRIKTGHWDAPMMRAARSFGLARSPGTAKGTFTAAFSGGTPHGDVWVRLSGPVNTTLILDESIPSQLSGLPDGDYTATVLPPAGCVLTGAQVGQEQATDLSAIPIEVDGTNFDVTLEFDVQSQTMFHSSASAENNVSTERWNKAYNVNLTATPQRTEPAAFDVVMVLDFSISMNLDINGQRTSVSGLPSRMEILKESVRKMVTTLTESPPAGSNLSIVSFSDDAAVRQEWIPLTRDNREIILGKIDSSWEPYNNTMAELGFKKARDMFAQKADSPNSRYVVYFTDGVNGSALLKREDYVPGFASYNANAFRVMAEAMNQAQLLKGPRGQSMTVNNAIPGFKMGSNNSRTLYYGAYLGEPRQQMWEKYTHYTDAKHSANYGSVEGGKYNRTGIGCGAEIFALGIFHGDSYGEEVRSIVGEYMLNIVDQDEDNFYNIDNEEALYAAFRALAGRMSGNYDNACVRYYYDAAQYKVTSDFEAIGGTIGKDGNGDYIQWYPISFNVEDPLNLSLVLEPTDPSNDQSPGGTLDIRVVENNTYIPIPEDELPRQITVTNA